MGFEVYRVTCHESGKSYVGCTTIGYEKRWRAHIYASKKERDSFIFQRAIAKYGKDAFSIELLGVVDTLERMYALEQEMIARYRTVSPDGYNLTAGGDGAHNPSAETRAKISAVHKGTKHWLGKTHTAETKARMSKAAIRSPEHRAAISKAQAGRSVSAETRAKISASKTGKKIVRSPEANAKSLAILREWQSKNKDYRPPLPPPEHMEMMRKAWTGRKHKPETVEKIRSLAFARAAAKKAATLP